MKQQDLQRAFGGASEAFRLRLDETLNGLEEKQVKKHWRVSTILAAAVLAIALAGAAVAATRLGVFDFLTNREAPITPLPGAEEMVQTNLGMTENELVTLHVEEAVFDGQAVLVKLRLSPKDKDRHALFHAFGQRVTDEYDYEMIYEEVPQGRMKLPDGGAEAYEIVNEDGVQRLRVRGAEVAIPESNRAAEEAGYPVFRKDGRLYYAGQWDWDVHGMKDGHELIHYLPDIRFPDGEMLGDAGDFRPEVDGSAVIWMMGVAENPLEQEEIRVSVRCGVWETEGEREALKPVELTLRSQREAQSARLEQVNADAGNPVQIVGGYASFTEVLGYVRLEYSCDLEMDPLLVIGFSFYTADGTPINASGGIGSYADQKKGIAYWNYRIQSFGDVPESILVEPRISGSDTVFDRIELKLVQK